MHTQKNDQIMFAFYRWDAKIKSCKEQDLFDICRQSQSLIRQLLNLVFEIHLVDLDRTYHRNFPGVDLGEKGGFCVQVTSQVSASKVTHTLRQCKKYQLDQQYTGLIFFFLSFEKPDYSLKKAEFLTEKSFSSGIFFLNFQDLCRQISDLAYRDSPRFSQALDLLNVSFLKEELTPVTHSHYSYRQILFGSEKLLLFLLLISPFLFRHTQTASFLQQYWPLFCAGFSLTAGVAALCWYSNYRFRQAVQLSSYRSILSEQTDPFSIRCAQDHFWGRQQVYLKNNSGRTFAYLCGCIQFWDRNTLVHTVSFALEQVAPRRAILLDTLYAKQNPLYLQKIHWDEISVDIRFLFADGSSPTRQKQTVYRSYPTYYAVLNHFHYWHIFSWRLPFETTWLTQEFFYRVKTSLLYWPKIPCAYGKIRSAIQVRFFFIRIGKRLFLSVFLIALFAFLLLGLTGLFLFAGFYVCQIMALFQ